MNGNRILMWELNSERLVCEKGESMPTTPAAVFHYEVQKSVDENTGSVTTITCHGRLVSETSGQIKQLVKPLIPMGRRIVLDLRDVSYAEGPGIMVGLKVSAIAEGYCRLELFRPPSRTRKSRGLRNLAELFSSRRRPSLPKGFSSLVTEY
jgi:hypothetical protein